MKLTEMQKEMLGRQSGAIRKCPHEIYWPAGDNRAFYCSLCVPEGLAAMTKPEKKSKAKRKKEDDQPTNSTGDGSPSADQVLVV